VRFLIVEKLKELGFLHGFSLREAGNMDPKNVPAHEALQNRRKFLADLRCEGWPILTAKQIHSNGVFVFTGNRENFTSEIEADALLTRENGLLLGIKTADCLPILVADQKKRAVAAIHAGWRGTVEKVTEAALGRMTEEFQSNPVDLVAVLGPSACGRCYEVRSDVFTPFEKAFGKGEFLKWNEPGVSAWLDIKAANIRQLEKAGLKRENIFVLDGCTIHENGLFFSHRVESRIPHARVGRMLAVIGLSPS